VFYNEAENNIQKFFKYQLSANEWLTYRYQPQKSYISRSLVMMLCYNIAYVFGLQD